MKSWTSWARSTTWSSSSRPARPTSRARWRRSSSGWSSAGSCGSSTCSIITKDADGVVDASELHEFDADQVGELRELGAEMAELLSQEDVGHIAAALEPGTVAAALVWENAWAAPFASSIRHAGGQLVASGRIPMQAIIAAVEAGDDVAQPEGA